MKTLTRTALLALTLGLNTAGPVAADPPTSASTYDDSGNYGNAYGYGRGRNLGAPGVVADLLLLRPFGLAMTIGGVGLLVATSPFTAIASAAPPHDAFLRVGNALVVGPAGFTFNRPLGEFSYQRSGVYPVLTKPEDRPVRTQAPVPVAPRPVTTTTRAPSQPLYRYAPDRLEYPADAREEAQKRQ